MLSHAYTSTGPVDCVKPLNVNSTLGLLNIINRNTGVVGHFTVGFHPNLRAYGARYTNSYVDVEAVMIIADDIDETHVELHK